MQQVNFFKFASTLRLGFVCPQSKFLRNPIKHRAIKRRFCSYRHDGHNCRCDNRISAGMAKAERKSRTVSRLITYK